MNLHITKSKNAESFYICKSYVKANGSTSSTIVRKLGTLEQLLPEHGPTRDDVVAWARNEAKIETEKYKKEKEAKTVLIPFHADRQLDYGKQAFFRGGYLFLQSVYYQLQMNKICRKLKQKYKFKYDINAILSDLIYTRILEPCSKRSSYKAASEFLEKPSYELHDVYRALDVLGAECDLIQAEVYKNSHYLGKRNDKILYYDCSNYYFEIEQEDGTKKYGKSKEHRPNPIIQMGLFMDGDGIPLAFSLFPGNANEQTSLKPLEKKVLGDFGCQKFIYCSDAGLGSEAIREYNHMGERAYIVTQSIKKLKKEEKEWALNPRGFKRVSDDTPVDITKLSEDDKGLYYKDEPYTTKKLHQRLIITYSPKYALYQKSLRDKQVERAQKMLDSGKSKKNRKNPNDPARFIGKIAVTEEGEAADIQQYLDEKKISDEARYDGFYAVCTDLLDGALRPLYGGIKVIVFYLVDLRERVVGLARAVLHAGKHRQDIALQIFKLRAEQVDRRRILGNGIVHTVKRIDDLEKCLPCRIPASGKPGRHSIRVHAEGLKGFGGGIAPVYHAQVKFLYRVAHLVNRKDTGFGTADQPAHKFVCGKAEGSVLRRVFVEGV